MKKLTRVAIECSVVKHAKFRYKIGLYYEPRQLIFVDESSCDRRTSYPRKAWGTVLFERHFLSVANTTLSFPYSLDGILHVNIVEGSFTTETFAEFIEGLLDKMNPFASPNSAIVMDNCSIHKAEIIWEMIENRGMCCLYLPPYSPDYNPMEPSFFKVKAYVHREGQAFRTATKADNDKLEVLTQLHNAVYSITPRDAEGWFRHSGYFQCIESFKKILGVSIAKKMWM